MGEPALKKDRVWSLPPAGFSRPSAVEHPTPYIEVDGFRLERNLAAMQARADGAGVKLRPHLKTHKSLEIGRRQIELGAAGLTASKPSEARVFVEGGFRDVTLAYPIVRPESLDALLESARSADARINVIAADPSGIQALSTAAVRHASRLACFLKVDVGLGRVGLHHSDPRAVDLARSIAQAPCLSFAGLLSHAGNVYAAGDSEGIRAVALREARELGELKSRLTVAGMDVPVVSTGATPTALGAPIAYGIQEIRPGNYVYLDLTALRLGICVADDIALSVVARVVAVNDRYAIIDAGSKTLSSDLGPHGIGGYGYGVVTNAEAANVDTMLMVERLSEEHGFVAHRGNPPPIGQMVRVFPNHACAVVAQFNGFVVRERDGTVNPSPIHARGCLA